MKFLVPDLAMVPKLFTRSALVMPMPESRMVSVFASRSGMICASPGGGRQERGWGDGGRGVRRTVERQEKGQVQHTAAEASEYRR